MVEEHETDAILLPGDLFHSRDLRPKVLDQAEQELDRLPNDVPVLVSRGNHDENLTPREVTWLNYLHRRGHIVFLKADLEADPETARFDPYNPRDPGDCAGFYDIEVEEFDGPVRIFGLQWRGARTAKALQQVANGIEATNAQHGEPAATVLLAHFGMEDEVPTLGGTVTHAELRELKEHVDYLALGHIHKRYEAAGWIYNPGSPEAHNTREGHHDWEHGYCSIALSPNGDGAEDAVEYELDHHPTKRRPYYQVEFDVTSYDSPSDLETGFQEHVRGEQAKIEEYCQKEEFTANEDSRAPIIDLRFNGTLEFSRGDFRTDELAEWLKNECDALYVQVNTGIRTADVQQLISEIDEEEVFQDGRLNTAALEHRVFETIAKESIYEDHAEDVADILGNVHQMAQVEEGVEDIRESVGAVRRELFPELAEDIVLDIDEDPYSDTDLDQKTESGDEEPNREESDEAEVVQR
jgi:DNA repair exonuclease SbcCD nuclease subunit